MNEKITFEESLATLLNILDDLKKENLSIEDIISKTKQAKEIYTVINKKLEEAKITIEEL